MKERYGSLTAANVAALDAAAVEAGVGEQVLMELAGWQVARCAWRMLRGVPGVVAVLAGPGNNGGDGAVAARHLSSWGCAVALHVLADADRVGDPLQLQLSRAEDSGVGITVAHDAGRLAAILTGSGVVVDALFGTGLSRPPGPVHAEAIQQLVGRRVLSVDVPSGLEATTGVAFDPCVEATMTCTLGGMKAGLWTAEGRRLAGALHVADIGLPRGAWSRCGLAAPSAVRGGGLVAIPQDLPPHP